MADNLPDKQEIYLALKNVFEDSKLRKRKRVLEHIAKQESSAVHALIDQHGIDVVGDTVVDLLKKGTFTSALPFTSSPASDHNRDLRQLGRTVTEVPSTHQGKLKTSRTDAPACHQLPLPAEYARFVESTYDSSAENGQVALCSKRSDPSSRASKRQRFCKSTPPTSVCALRLPMRAQHQVLTKVQQFMERACYEFARVAMPAVLQEKEWDCPECVELNTWAQLLKNHQHTFSPEHLVALERPVSEVLDSMSQLRHIVVHRVRVPAMKVKHFLGEAESIAKLLGCVDGTQALSHLHHTLESVIHDLIHVKHALALSLEEQRAAILATRAQLLQREELITDDAFQREREQEALASAALEEAVGSLVQSLYNTDKPQPVFHESDLNATARDLIPCD